MAAQKVRFVYVSNSEPHAAWIGAVSKPTDRSPDYYEKSEHFTLVKKGLTKKEATDLCRQIRSGDMVVEV